MKFNNFAAIFDLPRLLSSDDVVLLTKRATAEPAAG
jgi:hypothetical protein